MERRLGRLLPDEAVRGLPGAVGAERDDVRAGHAERGDRAVGHAQRLLPCQPVARLPDRAHRGVLAVSLDGQQEAGRRPDRSDATADGGRPSSWTGVQDAPSGDCHRVTCETPAASNTTPTTTCTPVSEIARCCGVPAAATVVARHVAGSVPVPVQTVGAPVAPTWPRTSSEPPWTWMSWRVVARQGRGGPGGSVRMTSRRGPSHRARSRRPPAPTPRARPRSRTNAPVVRASPASRPWHRPMTTPRPGAGRLAP